MTLALALYILDRRSLCGASSRRWLPSGLAYRALGWLAGGFVGSADSSAFYPVAARGERAFWGGVRLACWDRGAYLQPGAGENKFLAGLGGQIGGGTPICTTGNVSHGGLVPSQASVGCFFDRQRLRGRGEGP